MKKEDIQKLKSRLFFSRASGFDESYFSYLETTDPEIQRFQQLIRERRFSVGDTGVSYRVMGHWEEKNLLPVRKEEEGWRKFSFVELVWIYVLKHLREFNLNLEQLQNAKQNILDWDDPDDISSLFEFYLIKSLISDADSYVVVLPDARADIGFAVDIQDYLSDVVGDDLVVISLKNICKDLGLTPKRYRPLFYLSEAEAELIHTVRFGDYKKIELSPRNGKVIQMDLTKAVKVGVGDLVKELKEENGFADIITSFQAGKKESIKIKKKRRLDT